MGGGFGWRLGEIVKTGARSERRGWWEGFGVAHGRLTVCLLSIIRKMIARSVLVLWPCLPLSIDYRHGQLANNGGGAGHIPCGAWPGAGLSAMPMRLWMEGRVHLLFGSSTGGEGGGWGDLV